MDHTNSGSHSVSNDSQNAFDATAQFPSSAPLRHPIGTAELEGTATESAAVERGAWSMEQ